MGIATLFLQAGAIAFGGSYLEKKFIPSSLIFLAKPSTVAGLPRGFGLVIAVLSIASFWVMMYGMVVGQARSKYMELAKKDGEKDPELRYKLPNLYVDGNTVNARAFNCVQRSHQQVMETFTQFILMSIASGLSFPLTTTATCSLWLVARIVWARGYAASEGDPMKRYDHPLSKHIWTTLIAVFFMSLMTAVNVIAGDKFQFW